MSNKDIHVGAVVHLSEDSHWPKGDANPRGVDGVVTGHDPGDPTFIEVVWSTGIKNCYDIDDSDLIVIPGRAATLVDGEYEFHDVDAVPMAATAPSQDPDALVPEVHQKPADNLGSAAMSITKSLFG